MNMEFFNCAGMIDRKKQDAQENTLYKLHVIFLT